MVKEQVIKMRALKRIDNENKILSAGEKVFSAVGYDNAKMEDIAAEASITKVTLYSYFKSKENLYFGITYRALQLLIDEYHACIEKSESKPGIETVMNLQELFIVFNENNYLYSEALLQYFSVIRSSSKATDVSKLTKGIQESIYFKKLQDIQNIPIKLTAAQIRKGQRDGSIKKDVDPMLLTIYAWSKSIGYIKLISSVGYRSTLMHVNLQDVKALLLKDSRKLLEVN